MTDRPARQKSKGSYINIPLPGFSLSAVGCQDPGAYGGAPKRIAEDGRGARKMVVSSDVAKVWGLWYEYDEEERKGRKEIGMWSFFILHPILFLFLCFALFVVGSCSRRETKGFKGGRGDP